MGRAGLNFAGMATGRSEHVRGRDRPKQWARADLYTLPLLDFSEHTHDRHTK